MFARMMNMGRSADMTAAEAVDAVAKGTVTLVDIRDPMELTSGRAEGAISIPMSVLQMQADPRSPECREELKSGKPIVLYCASGGRASMAKGMLERMGHAEVHNIGGLVHWHQAGGAITR
jgi:rhodanese-related sulfurtransferase